MIALPSKLKESACYIFYDMAKGVPVSSIEIDEVLPLNDLKKIYAISQMDYSMAKQTSGVESFLSLNLARTKELSISLNI